jgi:hypothetical protein
LDKVQWPTGDEVVQEIAKLTDTILLSISRGKDSLACWLACKPYFKRIIPVHMDTLPGLGMAEDYLDYLGDKMGAQVIRVLHPNAIFDLRHFRYQSPQSSLVLFNHDGAWPKNYWYGHAQAALKAQLGLPPSVWSGFGIRVEDSMMRKFVIQKHGPINFNKHEFKPVWDWKLTRVVETIRQSGIKLPVEYRFIPRSWESYDYKYMANIERYFPEDYQRILKFFPLSRADFARHHFARERAHGKKADAGR